MQLQEGFAATADLARLSELIDSVYQAATDPSHWSVALPALADYVRAPKGLLFTPLHAPENGGYYFNHGIPESVMHLWGTRWHGEDILANTVVQRGLFVEGNVMCEDDVLPLAQLRAAPIYRELNHPNGIDHFLLGSVFGLTSLGGLPTALNFYRSGREGAFTCNEKDRLRIVLPHVSRAFGVMTRLRKADFRAAASLASLDRMASGVLLFDARGELSFANRAAHRILEEEDGLQLRHMAGNSGLGEVVAAYRPAQEALSAAIRGAVSMDVLCTGHFSRAVAVARPSGRQDYTLNFSTLAAHNEFRTGLDVPRAIAFITDSAEPVRLDAGLLNKTYGLTPAEIRVAEMLPECLTVDETAKRLGISRGTVKAHQQRIYEKTNTNSRAKLMKLLVSLAQVAP